MSYIRAGVESVRLVRGVRGRFWFLELVLGDLLGGFATGFVFPSSVCAQVVQC